MDLMDAVITANSRQRFEIVSGSNANATGERTYFKDVRPDPAGDHLGSLLPDGRHAPVVTVDEPVTALPVTAGTAVTFHGWRGRSNLIEGLTNLLARPGLVAPETALELRRIDSARGLGRLRRVRDVTVTFPYEVVVVPARYADTFDLLFQTSMDWADALRFAKLLANADLAMFRRAWTADQTDFMHVFQPL